MSNTTIFPAFVFGCYFSLWTWDSPDLLLDSLAALYAANASIWYHFCDTDTLDYCLKITKYTWENVTQIGNTTITDTVNYEWVTSDREVYEFTQYADFTGAFFMMSVAFLAIADVRPFPLRVVVYALALFFTWRAMAKETRFQKDGFIGVLKVIAASGFLAFCRVLLTVRHVWKKHAESGAPISILGALSKTLWLFPKRFCLLAGLFLPGGIATKILLEDETTGDYADYAVPHGWWHTLMFGGAIWVLGVALIFNRRARNYEPISKESTDSSNPMTTMELSNISKV
eukprot:CAMPEP_0182476836 /NCGR_PEP_ID=MMETSP1319-20130603/29835_1 /TAXON_ID=172717 /ORGANISM="Bolidomonas pacifica, Strain RCC208" /LENGTH=285 /DNA_ID=CAMNT_0024677965 /DNA_START=225 /DNA_END=1082 /DNA_ORIENTATION=+